MEWIPQYWHRSDMMGILTPVLDIWFSQRAGDWRTSSHHWCWNPSPWELVSYLLYNHWSLLYSRNQWVIVLKTKTKEQSPKPQGFAVFSWPSMAAKVCVTVSLWSCGEFGFSFGIIFGLYIFFLLEEDIFLLILHPSDISLLPACNGFHYFWCCEA